MSEEDFRPGEVTIPAPRRSTMPRGKYSSAKQAPTRSLRIPDEDYFMMNKAAAMCDMTWAEFMRWCAFHASIEIQKQHQLHGFK